MASDIAFVQYIAGQLHNVGTVRYRKMFGEYALYCNEKVVALVCDMQLFVKPTKNGEAFIGQPLMAQSYTGAKNETIDTQYGSKQCERNR